MFAGPGWSDCPVLCCEPLPSRAAGPTPTQSRYKRIKIFWLYCVQVVFMKWLTLPELGMRHIFSARHRVVLFYRHVTRHCGVFSTRDGRGDLINGRESRETGDKRRESEDGVGGRQAGTQNLKNVGNSRHIFVASPDNELFFYSLHCTNINSNFWVGNTHSAYLGLFDKII